ncbi:ATP-binding cassette domain-containing protein [Shewanella sp. GXUN23E]|uniref:ATP-binding cassette domain-containing protein n=1 Tax=Shewanella sp. GXUN23E TaxID=3422498 RepID=UPI003D7C6A1B
MAEHLIKTFGGLLVDSLSVSSPAGEMLISPLSFVLQPGELVGLIGASGSGKSVLGNALLGAVPRGYRLGGKVHVSGNGIALAPQSGAALDPLRTVLQHLKRRLGSGQSLQQAEQVISHMGKLYPHELSGGMTKRALLAQACVQGRDFLVADEPCCGLDPSASIELYQMLRQQADKGIGVLVISHNLRKLCRVADRLLVLDNGCLVETLTPEQLQRGQGSHYSSALWQALPEHWERAHAEVA